MLATSPLGVVLDKPSGVRTERLLEAAAAQLRLDLRAVSRLDKGTSGCLAVAVGEAGFQELKAAFAGRAVDKARL